MDSIAVSTARERAELFLDTVEVHPLLSEASLIEKDFWLCWVLSRLYSIEIGVSFLFKGGTSLSKAYPVIQRLSEDIDLSIDRRDLGVSDPSEASSEKQRKKRIEALIDCSKKYISEVLLRMLLEDFSRILGAPKESHDWKLELDPEDDQDQTILMKYPITSVTPSLDGYVSPIIRLELGARSDHWPSELRTIKPYAAEAFPQLFSSPSCVATTLKAERTFWEKAVILHKTFHGGLARLKTRLARHYYDVHMLVKAQVAEEAIQQPEILKAVARHARIFFAQGWAKYEDAKPGTLRLVPNSEISSALESDYRDMKDLFFSEPPAFEEIVSTITEIEDQINQ